MCVSCVYSGKGGDITTTYKLHKLLEQLGQQSPKVCLKMKFITERVSF